MGHFRVAGRPRWEAGAGWSSWGQQDVEVGLSLTWCSDRRVNLACGFPHTALSWPPWLALPPGAGVALAKPLLGRGSAALGAVAVTPPLQTLQAPPGPHRGSCLPRSHVWLCSRSHRRRPETQCLRHWLIPADAGGVRKMLSLLSLLKSGRSALGQTEVTPRGVRLDLLLQDF